MGWRVVTLGEWRRNEQSVGVLTHTPTRQLNNEQFPSRRLRNKVPDEGNFYMTKCVMSSSDNYILINVCEILKY